MAKATVLVVEDHPLNLELVRDLLLLNDFEVMEATNAQEALEAVEARIPDLIVMDIQLPNVDGLSLTKMLKSDPKTKDVIVVALTAHAMKGDEARAYEAGCSGYISKPIDTRAFPKILGQILDTGKRSN